MRLAFWRKPSELEVVIEDVMTRMRVVGPDDPEYDNLVKYLGHLTKMRDEARGRRVSPDTVAIIVGNLVIAVVVVLAERDSVLSTKFRDFQVKRQSKD